MNQVNGLAHQESLKAQNWYLGDHGFDSPRGLRFFLCPTPTANEHFIFINCYNINICLFLFIVNK